MIIEHYDDKYFEWQKKVGEFGGEANLFKFEKHIQDEDVVLDFGCGGGFLLNNINCRRKIGVEVNPDARKYAEKKGIECFASIEGVRDESVDIIISNHALEHVDNPVFYVKQFGRVLKSGGKVVICVPHEVNKRVNKEDIHMHMYTWSPQNLYNLFKVCGFNVQSCKRLTFAWMKHFITIQKIVGWKAFGVLCRINGMRIHQYQTILIGNKI